MADREYRAMRWAKGELNLNPADAGEQNQLRQIFKNDLDSMEENDVRLLATLLIKKGSSFISAMLHRYNILTTRQKIAALNALAKRRRERVSEFRDAPVSLEFEVLSKISPKRRLRIINTFLHHKKAKNELTEEQFDILLFPLSTSHTEKVGELKEHIFRKKMHRKYSEARMKDMIANDELIKFRTLMSTVSDSTLKKMIIEGGDWPDALRYKGEDALLTMCIKRGLIKKEG